MRVPQEKEETGYEEKENGSAVLSVPLRRTGGLCLLRRLPQAAPVPGGLQE